jgi:hypothetical protein
MDGRQWWHEAAIAVRDALQPLQVALVLNQACEEVHDGVEESGEIERERKHRTSPLHSNSIQLNMLFDTCFNCSLPGHSIVLLRPHECLLTGSCWRLHTSTKVPTCLHLAQLV